MKAKLGLRVQVFSPYQKNYWGLGTIEKIGNLFGIDKDDKETVISENYPSRIKLDNGKITEGSKCWWISLEEVYKICEEKGLDFEYVCTKLEKKND